MGGALCFTRKSEDLQPPLPILHRGPLLAEDSRWGGCWWMAGGVPLWAVSPLWCFPPRCLGAVPPPVLLLRVAASFHVCVLPVLWRPGAWPTSRPMTCCVSGHVRCTNGQRARPGAPHGCKWDQNGIFNRFYVYRSARGVPSARCVVCEYIYDICATVIVGH